MQHQAGKWLILIGLTVLAAGLLLYFFGDRLRWLGRLPGDIRVEREGFHFYFPVVTMILLSVAGSAVLWLIRRIKGG